MGRPYDRQFGEFLLQQKQADTDKIRALVPTPAPQPEPQPAAPTEAAPAPESAVPATPPQEPASEPTGNSGWSTPGDYAMGALHGFIDAGRETLQLLAPEGWQSVLEAGLYTPDKEDDKLGAGLVRNITQYASMSVPVTAALVYAGAPLGISGLVAGATTSAVTFDPRERGLGNLIESFGGNWAAIGGVTAVHPDDTEWEGRAKHAAEDVAVTMTTLGLAKLVPGFRAQVSRIIGGKKGAEDSIEGVVNGLQYDEAIDNNLGSEILDRVRELQAARDQVNATELAYDIVRTQSPEALDSIRAENPQLAKYIEHLMDDKGALGQINAAAKQNLTAVETAYAGMVEGLEPTTARKIAAVVDRSVPADGYARTTAEATALRINEHLAQKEVAAGAVDPAKLQKGWINSRILPGTKIKSAAEKTITALRDGRVGLAKGTKGTQRRDGDLNAIAFHLEPDEWWRSTSVEEVVTNLARFMSKAVKKEKLLGIKKGEDPIVHAATLYAGNTGNAVKSTELIKRMFPQVAPEDAVLALRLTEMSTAHRIHALTQKGQFHNHDLAHFLRLNRLGQNAREILAGRAGQLDGGVDLFAQMKPTEAGQRISKEALKIASERSDEALVHAAGGPEKVRKMMVAWGNSIPKLNEEGRFVLGRVSRGGWELAADAGYEVFVNTVLGATRLWQRNVVTNTFFGLLAPFEDKALGILTGRSGALHELADTYRYMVDGLDAAFALTQAFKGAKQSVKALGRLDMREAWQGVKGVGGALRQSNVGRAVEQSKLQTGGPESRVIEFDDSRRAVSEIGRRLSDKIKPGSSIGHTIANAVGTAANISNKMLIAGDELAKSINWYAHTGREARALARQKGMTGPLVDRFVYELRNAAKMWHVLEPDEVAILARKFGTTERELVPFLRDFDEAAQQYSRKLTFSDALAANSRAGRFQTFVRTAPGLRWTAPFVRVSAKIMERAAERTPAVYLPWTQAHASYSRALAQGGVAAEAAKSRMIIGTGIATLLGGYSLGGRFFGRGPLNPQENKNLRELTGATFNSIGIESGGQIHYVPLDLVQPYGKIVASFGTLAEVFMNQDDAENQALATNIVVGLTELLTDGGPYEQFMDVVAAVRNPEQHPDLVARYLTGMLPMSKLFQFEGDPQMDVKLDQEISPAVHKYAAWLQDVAESAYGAKVEGKLKVNVLGEPILRPGMTTTRPVDDDFTREIERLSELGRGLRLNTEEAYSMFGSGPSAVQLRPEQRADLIKMATNGHFTGGVTMRKMLNDAINSGFYRDKLTDGGQAQPGGGTGSSRAEYLENLIRARIRQAWIPLANKYPELMKTYMDRKLEAGLSQIKHSNKSVDELLNPN